MKKCIKCGEEIGEDNRFCPKCGAAAEIKFPVEELGFLKTEFGFMKNETKVNFDDLRREVNSQNGKLDTISRDIKNKKEEEHVGSKIASVMLLLNGVSYLSLGGIIAGLGSMLWKMSSMIPVSMVPGVVVPTNAMLDTVVYIGLIFLGIGLLSVSLPYYLWKGSKAAATVTVLIMMVELVAVIYESILLSGLIPTMSQGFMLASVPGAILAIVPMLLINKDWDALK